MAVSNSDTAVDVPVDSGTDTEVPDTAASDTDEPTTPAEAGSGAGVVEGAGDSDASDGDTSGFDDVADTAGAGSDPKSQSSDGDASASVDAHSDTMELPITPDGTDEPGDTPSDDTGGTAVEAGGGGAATDGAGPVSTGGMSMWTATQIAAALAAAVPHLNSSAPTADSQADPDQVGSDPVAELRRAVAALEAARGSQPEAVAAGELQPGATTSGDLPVAAPPDTSEVSLWRTATTGTSGQVLRVVGGIVIVAAVAAVTVVGMRWWQAESRRPAQAATVTLFDAIDTATATMTGPSGDRADIRAGAVSAATTLTDASRQASTAAQQARSGSYTAAAQRWADATTAAAVALAGLGDMADPADWVGVRNDVAAATATMTGLDADGWDVALAEDVDPVALLAAADHVLMVAAAEGAIGLADPVVEEFQDATSLAAYRNAAEVAAATTDQIARYDRVIEAADTPESDVSAAAADVVIGVETMLAGFADLVNLDVDRLAEWPAVRERLRGAVADVADAEDDLAGRAGSVAGDARQVITTMDSYLADGQQQLDTWNGQVAAAEAANADELSTIDSYVSTVESVIGQYSRLRDDTSQFTNRIRTGYVTYAEAYAYFGGATEARRQLRNQLAGTTPPEGISAEHARLISVLDNGIAGTQAAIDGIREDEYCYYYCDYATTYGWTQFQAASDQNSGSWPAATSAWNDTAEGLRQAVIDRSAPPRPTL